MCSSENCLKTILRREIKPIAFWSAQNKQKLIKDTMEKLGFNTSGYDMAAIAERLYRADERP